MNTVESIKHLSLGAGAERWGNPDRLRSVSGHRSRGQVVANKKKISSVDAPLLEAVFGKLDTSGSATRQPTLLLGILVALAAHAGLLLVAHAAEPSSEPWTAHVAALAHADLTSVELTEVESVPLPRPKPQTAPSHAAEPEQEPLARQARAEEPKNKEAEHLSHKSPRADQAEASSDEAKAPSRAGGVVAVDQPNAPVDFTDNVFLTGTASTYKGGASASSGTKALVQAEVIPGGAGRSETNTAAKPKSPSMAHPVQLPADHWRCAWPKTALSQDIYEQYVVLRVRVGSSGAVEEVMLESDPGYGFGAAALACAKRTRFSPARNEAGIAVAATSPPIRVRFTR